MTQRQRDKMTDMIRIAELDCRGYQTLAAEERGKDNPEEGAAFERLAIRSYNKARALRADLESAW